MNFLRKLFGGQSKSPDPSPQQHTMPQTTPQQAAPQNGQASTPSASPAEAQPAAPEAIVVVSGLPRSGTSMMMKMLEAGGLPVMSDGLRAADPDNPEGYYELERVKELHKGDMAWLGEARGQVIKVISALLEHLPSEQTYRILFMHRRVEEVLRSQRKMLVNRGEQGEAVSPDETDDAEMAELFAKHVQDVQAWVREQPNMAVLDVDYNAMLQDPLPYVRSVNQFLGSGLDERAMVNAVNPDLYRNRAG